VTSTRAPDRSQYRRLWLPELIVLAVLFLVTVLVFWVTGLDHAAMDAFYVPDHPATRWPYCRNWLADLFYESSPYLTGVLGLSAVAMMVAGTYRRGPKHLRLYGAFILLTGFVGPGLVVNAVFKDWWGHPRPRQTVRYGGRNEYVVKPVPGRLGSGKSFPCGHCSVGFLYSAFWFIYRRKNLRIAIGSLVLGFVLGAGMGVARMAAGGHFLSDVIWAWLLTHLIGLCVYYFWLNVPGREDAPEDDAPVETPRQRRTTIAVVSGVSVVMLAILLYAHPQSFDVRFTVARGDLPRGPWTAEFVADKADVSIVIVEDDDPLVVADGYVRSFGLPTNRLIGTREVEKGTPRVVRYSLSEKGIFADLEAALHFRLASRELSKVLVRLGEGDVIVTAEGDVPIPELDVDTEKGEATLPTRD
jgi:membrane-associated PAP2 superfamily phosphatase